jgi:ABC-type glycerol-3-phosphate transport system substrate-binding protein
VGKRSIKKTINILLVTCLLVSITQFSGISTVFERYTFEVNASSPIDAGLLHQKLDELEAMMTHDQSDFFELYYLDIERYWTKENVQEGTETIVIQGEDISDASIDSFLETGSYDGRDHTLIWAAEQSEWVEYEVVVKEGGLYEMIMEYQAYTPEGNKGYKPTVMSVSINGEFPFREARAIEFPKLFRDDTPLQTDSYGDHVRPNPTEITQWQNRPFKDADGAYLYPLKWHFPEGTHTIRFETYEPIVIDQVTIRPQVKVEAYELVSSEYPSSALNTNEIQMIEGQFVTTKNDVSLQMISDNDPLMSPVATKSNILFNGLGGIQWRNGGDAASWEFEVPESGVYKIAMRTHQNFYSNRATFRNIYIDGIIPFEEMFAYRIPYSMSWEGITFESDEGVPFEFYLEKGIHTLTLEATYAPYNLVSKSSEKVTKALNDLNQDLNAMTGGTDDRNRTWNISQSFPEIPQRLELMKDVLQMMSDELIYTNGRLDNNSQSLITTVNDIKDMLDTPNEIPYSIDNIATIQQRIGVVRGNVVKVPLIIDKFYIAPYEQKLPKMKANLWQKMKVGFGSFFYSFNDERRMSYNEDEVLNVWMFMGRDYVNLLQEMANQYFTPETGIPVKIDLVPREELIVLANATGKAPDVAIGMSEGKPVEFAVRDAAESLSKYPGFNEMLEQYAPGAMLPYYFEDNYYAFPETQSFRVLFYRKDILDRLGLEVPNTWDEVFKMLPTLQQNHYNFFIPPSEFLTFIYQYGADFYTKDGMKTGLDTPEAFKAFKTVTDFFAVKGIDRQVPSFYQHFRDGFMPLGISDFNTYLEMMVAAPELHGWWGIAPLPGMEDANGVVERWSGGNLGMLSQGLGGFGGARMDSGGGGQTATMMFKNSQNKDWGWEFISWWLSAETQKRFGMNLEGFYGVEFRWNTANLEAFTELPWTHDELDVLLEQWRWYKAMMIVPGSYFIPRELQNAWNRTVLDGMNYRTSLEEGILNINREIHRKSIEFGFRNDLGEIIHTYDPPQVNEPWKGVDRYVND